MRPIILLDHSNISQRAFYGTFRPGQPVLSAPDGFPTNCIATWASTVDGLVRRHDPERLIVVFDGKPTRRTDLHSGYKAGRLEKPDMLKKQLPVLAQVVQDSGLEFCYEENEEADDLIATLAKRLSATAPVLIASADKDFSQCVTPRVHRLIPQKGGEWQVVDEAAIQAEYGVRPSQFAQYLALIGDTVDAIPGIEGIGPGRAAKILAGDPDIEAIVDRIAASRKWPRDAADRQFRLSLSLSSAIDLPDAPIRRGEHPERAFATLDRLQCRRAERILENLLDRASAPELTSLLTPTAPRTADLMSALAGRMYPPKSAPQIPAAVQQELF